MRILSLITIYLFLAACTNNSGRGRYASLVEEWQGRTIEFPSVMVDVATGDTIDMSDADFTLLTYVDSAGCTSCRMRLSLWTKFIESFDSIAGDYEVLPLIVVNTDDDYELSHIIHRAAYIYSVINDKTDSLNTLNRFPEKQHFRSFLLNSDKQVIAIGDPLTNDAVANLYRSLISGSTTFSSSGHKAVAAIPSRRSVGEIPLGQERSSEFTIKNQSSDSMYIRDIITSCHCTTVTVVDSIIPPGVTVPVKVTLREDSVTGDFQRSIHIYYRDFDNPTVLHLSGTVIL